jgi:hypothetical protein
MRTILGTGGVCMVLMAATPCACSINNSNRGNNDDKPGSGATNDDASAADGSSDSSVYLDAQPEICPGTTVASCPARIPSFSREIAFIVQSRCSGCHSPFNDAGLWPLNDRESLSDWKITILQVLRGCTQPPPDSGVALTSSERQTFEAWLVCGASDN